MQRLAKVALRKHKARWERDLMQMGLHAKGYEVRGWGNPATFSQILRPGKRKIKGVEHESR